MLERKQCIKCKSMRPLCGFDKKPRGKGQLKDKCIFCLPPEVKESTNVSISERALNLSYQHNYRAKMAGVSGRINQKEILSILDKYNRCLSCGTTENLTIDHVKPMSDGGCNTIDNMQVLCKSCNSRKGTSEIDYREIQQ